MAYLKKPDEEFQTAQPLMGGGGGGAASAVGGGQVTNHPSQGSGQFVNFDKYIQANKNVAGQMANRVTAGVRGAADRATGKLDSAVTNFNRDVQAGMTPGVQPIMGYDPAGGNGGGYGTVAQPGQMTYEQALKYGGERGPDGTLLNNPYTGPTSLSKDPAYDYSGVQKAIYNGQGELNGTASAGGQAALLSNYYGGNGGYQAGMSRFDAALMGRTAGNQFSQLRQQYGDLTSKLKQADATSADTSKKAATDSAANADAWLKEAQDYNRNRLDQIPKQTPQPPQRPDPEEQQPGDPTGPVNHPIFSDPRAGGGGNYTMPNGGYSYGGAFKKFKPSRRAY